MENLRFKALSARVQVDHKEVLKRLSKAAAQVDMATQMVRLPEDVIEAALKVVPREVTLGGHSGRKDLTVPHPDGLFYTLINTGSRNYLDPETNTYRPLTLADMAEWAQLCEAVDEMDCCSINTPRDVPDETCDIHALKTVFENTTKHVILQPFSFKSVKYLFEMAVAAAGGKEEFRKHPLISPFVPFNSPLLLADYNAEIMLQCAEHRAPITDDSLPSAGATSPITIAGTVLLACAEILSIAVMAQLLGEGTPIIARPLAWGIDMATGRSTGYELDSAAKTLAHGDDRDQPGLVDHSERHRGENRPRAARSTGSLFPTALHVDTRDAGSYARQLLR